VSKKKGKKTILAQIWPCRFAQAGSRVFLNKLTKSGLSQWGVGGGRIKKGGVWEFCRRRMGETQKTKRQGKIAC